MNRPVYFVGFIFILIVSVSSWGLVWDGEWSGDPPGVWRPEPDPPGDQTAAPAACNDLGWTTAICFSHHWRGHQEGSRRCFRTGTFKTPMNKGAFSNLRAVQLSGSSLVFDSQMDSASQQQLASVLATQDEVLKNLNELRWVATLVAVDFWTRCCFCKKKKTNKQKTGGWVLNTPGKIKTKWNPCS